MNLSYQDSSSISPTVTPNQSGGTNRIQVTAADSIFPFTNQGDGGIPPLAIIVGLLGAGVVMYFFLRKK